MAMQIRSFQKVIAAAGTEVQLSDTSICAKWVRVAAVCATATHVMYIGASDVASTTGDAIPHGQAWVYNGVNSSGHVESIDLSTIWVDAQTTNDKVTVSYLQA